MEFPNATNVDTTLQHFEEHSDLVFQQPQSVTTEEVILVRGVNRSNVFSEDPYFLENRMNDAFDGDHAEDGESEEDGKMEVDQDSVNDGTVAQERPSPEPVDFSKNALLVPKQCLYYLETGTDQPAFETLVYQAKWKGNLFHPQRGSGTSTETLHPMKPEGCGRNAGNSDMNHNIGFGDCGGLEKHINWIRATFIQPLEYGGMENYKRFQLEAPKGVLFHGPPGTGKTLFAQAISNELKVVLGRQLHFIHLNANDIVAKYFGQSSQNLRQVFQEACAKKPAIIFFDELDGLFPNRDEANEASTSVVTTMLGLMDELPQGQVFVIGATNRLEAMDPALRRPGRFDQLLEFLPPSGKGRLDILKIHTQRWKTPPEEALLQNVSERTPGFSGADLANLCQKAFDRALERMFGNDENDLENLAVDECDWKFVLQTARQSNRTFGSTVCTCPPLQNEGYLQKLVQGSIQALKNKLIDKVNNLATACEALYVWSDGESSAAVIDDLIVAPVLNSAELNGYRVFCLESHSLFTSQVKKWSGILHKAFSQVAAQNGVSILYIKDADTLWNAIDNKPTEGPAETFTKLLEGLSGKPVFVLATGITDPSEFPCGHPLRNLMTRRNSTWNVEFPSPDDTYDFFIQLFAPVVTQDPNWTKERLECLRILIGNATVDVVGEKSFESALSLYHALQQGLGQGFKAITDIVGDYHLKRLYPTCI